MRTNTGSIFMVLLLMSFASLLLPGCQACPYEWEEQNGSIVCAACEEVCEHKFEEIDSRLYCVNCLYEPRSEVPDKEVRESMMTECS